MSFEPSQFSESAYGWADSFPLSALTVTGSGLSNQPASEKHRANLSLLSDFLGKLPFDVQVTSGYRSPSVNAAAEGSGTSQHMNGLGVDFIAYTPGSNRMVRIPNWVLATFLYSNRWWFPELDQVIWYRDSSHLHVGICPGGATGCPTAAARKQFKVAWDEGSTYSDWAPSPTDLNELFLRIPPYRPRIVTIMGISTAISVVALAVGYKFRHKIKRRLGIK